MVSSSRVNILPYQPLASNKLSLIIFLEENGTDQSDLESRIRTLSNELKRRKTEAEALKKEQHQKRKMKLKAEEESLKKQIAVKTNYFPTKVIYLNTTLIGMKTFVQLGHNASTLNGEASIEVHRTCTLSFA